MKQRRFSIIFVLLLSLLMSISFNVLAHEDPLLTEPPDIVLVNGNIATVDDDFSFAEALAIRENLILAVGTNEEMQSLVLDGTQVIDLDGRTVLPGLIDEQWHENRHAYQCQLQEEHLDEHLDTTSSETETSPFVNLWAAVSERMPDPNEVVAAEEQLLMREEALQSMMVKCDQATDQDGRLGSLQADYYADLIVLSDDYFTVPVDDIRSLTSVLTIVDGRIVYADGDYAGLDESEADHEHADADHEHDDTDHEHADDADHEHAEADHEHADDSHAGVPNNGAVVHIVSPVDGATVSASDFVVEIETENFPLGEDGNHWHVYVDGAAWGMIMGDDPSYALNGVEPGKHKIAARLSNGLHEELEEGAEITVTVR